MKGFFFQKEQKQTKQKTKTDKSIVYGCDKCGLHKQCLSPKMPVTGKGKLKILIVAEAPGKTEDEQGVQLVGQSGQLLRKALKKYDVVLDRDCWKTNAVICRPPKNKKPTTTQINSCRFNLLKTIQELKPEKIILLGSVALQSWLNGRMSMQGSISAWVGWSIPDMDHNCFVFPTYHPAYLLRSNDPVLDKIFDRHIFSAINHNKLLPKNDFKINILQSPFEACVFLSEKLPKLVSIDFETTGLKPQRPGHEILCMSVSADRDSATVFPIFDDAEFLRCLRNFLRDEDIKKIIQNVPYEWMWAKIILKCEIRGIVFDTMIAQHIIDNRTGITGLKLNGFVRYGVCGYDNEIKKYIEASTATDFNRLKQVDINDIMQYCGIDTILAYRWALDIWNIKDLEAYRFFHDGELALVRASTNGICVDEVYLHQQQKILQKKMLQLTKKMKTDTDVIQWEKDKSSEFNPNSSKHLRELFFEYKNLSTKQKTETGLDSTSSSTLETLNDPLAKIITKHKKLEKLNGTYIKGFINSSVNGYMHPSFNLNRVATFRSSSSDPNFQNIPKHDMYAQKLTRRAIIPRPGRQLLECDYSGVEVRVGACNHKDPAMIAYIKDPKTDMHRDMAMELFGLTDPASVAKNLRQGAKNGFVFPQFYGDYYGNNARLLWDSWMTDEDKKMIKKTLGIKTYKQFENHVKKVEQWFRYKKFPGFTAWKEKILKQYEIDGYIDMLTGFRCWGPLSKNQVLNFKIQGPAFHMLLWSFIQLEMYLRKNKFDTLIVGQIHDSIVLDVVPDELPELKPVIRKIMTEDIREHWKWIIVPLDIDAEITDIDGSWAVQHKEEI